MQELPANITYTRTCSRCQRFINSNTAINDFLVLCSYKCCFNLIYKLLDEYSEKELLSFAHTLSKNEKELNNKNVLKFELSKYYVNNFFITIKGRVVNNLVTCDKIIAHVQRTNSRHTQAHVYYMCCDEMCDKTSLGGII